MPTTKEVLVKIEENQQLQIERCATCRDLVEKHDKTLNGNGSMGLKTKVGIMFWLFWVFGSAAAAALGGMIKSAVGF